MTKETLSPWYSSARTAWEREVAAWLSEMGEACALGAIKSVTTVKERPWSVVRRVSYEAGDSYFKACSDAGKHEPALHLFLEQYADLPIPRSQAVNLENDWILTADAGVALRQVVTGADQVRAFARLLTPYARMQIACLAWVDRLLDMNLHDRRLQRLPALLDSLLSLDAAEVAQKPAAWRELCAAARRRLSELERVCAELTECPYAVSLDHGDLHQANVLVDGATMRLSDWGDACVTHPFCSLMVTLDTVLSNFEASERRAWAHYLRDAYLEAFTALETRPRLLADFQKALWLAHLIRALNCASMFRAAPQEILNRWRPLIFEQLRMWVDHDYG